VNTKVRSLYGVPLRSLIVTRQSPPGSVPMSKETHNIAVARIKAARARLLSNVEFRDALEAIVGFKRRGPHQRPVKTGLLQQILRGFTILDEYGKGAPRKDWEKLWARGTGKTWKALTEFPERLRGMADEVEGVDRNKYFGSELAQQLEMSGAKLPPLPDILRDYAYCYDGLIRLLRERAGKIPYSRPNSEYPLWVFELSEIVKVVTGRYCDREVVELLDAAAAALGKPRAFASRSALNLAQARSRLNRRTCRS